MRRLLQALESSATAEDGGVIAGDPTTVEMGEVLRRSCEMDGVQLRPGSVTWRAVLIQGSVLLVFLICGGLVFWVLEGGKNATQQVSVQQVESVTLATNLLNNVTRHLGK